MKVILIDPVGNRVGLNTGLAYLAGALKMAGHRVHVIDFNNYQKDKGRRLDKARNADLVGISVKSFTADEAHLLACKVRALNHTAKIICGGCHITIDGKNYLTRHPVFDLGVAGHGEQAVLDLCNAIPQDQISGLIFREKGRVLCNQILPLEDIDSLPYPDYACFDSLSTYKCSFPYNAYPLVTSRGCPSRCVYCAVPLMSRRRWQGRAPDRILDELLWAKRKYRIKEFAILDDNFTVNIDRAKSFCNKLITANCGLTWQCSSGIKAKGFDDQLAGLMKSSGVTLINFGVETCDPAVFERIGKGGTLDDVLRGIQVAKKHAIKVGGFFIIGLPGSSKNSDLETIKHINKLNLDRVFWSILSPYPGTDLYDLILSDKSYRFIKDWRLSVHCNDQVVSTFETDDYSAAERVDMYFRANIMVGSYGSVLNANAPNIKKAITLMRMVLKYDPARLFMHVLNILKGLMLGLRLKTVKPGW